MSTARPRARRGRVVAVVVLLPLTLVAVALPVLFVLGEPPERPRPDPRTAATTPAPDLVRRDDPEAVAMLTRSASAARTVAYIGVTRMWSWDQASVGAPAEILHLPGEGTFVRSAADPGSGTGWVRTAPDEALAGSPLSDGAQQVTLLARNHAVRLAGNAKVAGRRAGVVDVLRGNGSRYARYWVDLETGLLLRRVVYDGDTGTASKAWFATLQAGPRVRAEWTPPEPAGAPADPAPTMLDEAALASHRADGWACPEALPGGMMLLEALPAEVPGGGDAVHLVYSDGVSTVSLFEQPGTLDADAMAGDAEFVRDRVEGGEVWRSPSTPGRFVWQSGDSVFTLVADIPRSMATSVIAAVPPDLDTDDGVWDRLRRGSVRVRGWLLGS